MPPGDPIIIELIQYGRRIGKKVYSPPDFKKRLGNWSLDASRKCFWDRF